MLLKNKAISSDNFAPAVGNILAFSTPKVSFTLEKINLSAIEYPNFKKISGFLPLRRTSTLCFFPVATAHAITPSIIGEYLDKLSLTPAYTFSQNRGTAHIRVGRTSLIVC